MNTPEKKIVKTQSLPYRWKLITFMQTKATADISTAIKMTRKALPSSANLSRFLKRKILNRIPTIRTKGMILLFSTGLAIVAKSPDRYYILPSIKSYILKSIDVKNIIR